MPIKITPKTEMIEISSSKFSLKRLTSEDWSWVHFKVVIFIWAIMILNYTPTPIANALGILADIFAIVTALGILISVTGIIMSAQIGSIGLIGLTIEYSGIIFTATGPFTYLMIQLYLATKLPDGDQRYALCVLAYVVIAALFARFRTVRMKRRRLLHTPMEAR